MNDSYAASTADLPKIVSLNPTDADPRSGQILFTVEFDQTPSEDWWRYLLDAAKRANLTQWMHLGSTPRALSFHSTLEELDSRLAAVRSCQNTSERLLADTRGREADTLRLKQDRIDAAILKLQSLGLRRAQ